VPHDEFGQAGEMRALYKPYWQREYWDRFIRSEYHFCYIKNYIENNPVKAGLCKSPSERRWSSAYGTAALHNNLANWRKTW
jgi:putative DNA methylase